MRKQTSKPKAWYFLAGAGILVYVLIEAQGKGDFYIFLSAARDIWSAENIYLKLYHTGLHYYYSPLFAILLSPFNILPLYWAKVCWLLLNVFFLYRLWGLIYSLPGKPWKGKREGMWFTLLCFLFVIRFIRDNFHHSQMTIFIMLLSLWGLVLIRKGNYLTGALLLALGINFKILPLIFFPWLLYRGYFKASLTVAVFSVALVFMPAILIGWHFNLFLSTEWLNLIDPLKGSNMTEAGGPGAHSLSTLVPALFAPQLKDSHSLDIPRHIADLGIETAAYILNALRLLLALITLYFLRSMPFTREKNDLSFLWEISYLFLLIPLIFPHQLHYAWLTVWPASAYLVYWLTFRHRTQQSFRRHYSCFLYLGTMALLFIIFNSSMLLGEYDHFYNHYKILVYGGLLMIIPLMAAKPGKVCL